MSPDQERELIERGIAAMEPPRRSAGRATVALWAAVLATAGAVWAVYRLHPSAAEHTPEIVVGVSGAVIVLVLWGIAHAAAQKLRTAWDSWRSEVVKSISSDARFAPRECIGSSDFDGTGLNTERYNRYSGSNLLRVGAISCCRIVVDRVETRYRTVTYTDAQGRTQTRQEAYQVTIKVFHGSLINQPIALHHPCHLVMSNNGLPRAWKLRPVRVAHNDLAGTYHIGAAPDEFAGHRILTPSLMTALWDFRCACGSVPRISFRQDPQATVGQCWLAIPDVYLDFGRQPGLSRRIKSGDLRSVMSHCEGSIAWLSRTAAAVQPN